MRVSLVAPGFAPYRAPLWNALAHHCDLQIVLLSAKAKHRKWEADLDALHAPVVCLGGPQIVVRKLDWVLNVSARGTEASLARHRPDVIVMTSYQSPAYWVALRWAGRHRVPVVLALDGHLQSSRMAGSSLVTAVKRAFVRRCAAAYTYTGRPGREYLRWLGMPDERIVAGFNTIDQSRFPESARIGDQSVARLLYVGQFLPRKGIGRMLEALRGVIDLPWHLTIVGAGPQEANLRQMADSFELTQRIAWRDYVPYERIADVYRSADILLFPSLREVWGLVVNEALTSGTYVIGSRRAAATQELIRPGENGEVIEPDDVEQFTSVIRQALAQLPFDRVRIRASVISKTPQAEARKLFDAVQIAYQRQAAP